MENNRSFYNEILTDHNLHPMHKHPLDTATASLEGVNPSCGDDIVLNLNIKDGVDRKSTRLNSSTLIYLVCRLLLEKK